MFTAAPRRDAHAGKRLPTIRISSIGDTPMSWRNGPHARAPGSPSQPERLPRAIAARLKSAGYLTEIPVTRPASNAAVHDADDASPTRHENQDDPQGSPEQ
jgi:hypothetical protein